MSVQRATKKRNVPQKKGAKRQNNSSIPRQSKSPVVRGQMRLYKKPISQVNEGATFKYAEPEMMSQGGTTTIRHSEMIMAITKTAAQNSLFTPLGRLRVNPGSETTFPWLSSLALSWENFRFKRVQFRFLTRSSTATNGSLLMSPDYDSSDGQLVGITEAQVFSNVDTIDLPIYTEEIICKMNVQRLNRLYKAHTCMSDARFNNTKQDSKTIDPAQLFLYSDAAVAGASQTYGKIVVDYEVVFNEPQTRTEGVNAGGFAAAGNNGSLSLNSAALLTTAFPATKSEPISPPLAFNNSLTEVVYPTPIVGKFQRDWTGPITTQLQGTGFSNFFDYFVGPTNGPIGVDDIIQTINTANDISHSTAQSRIVNIIGLANQYLKIRGPAIMATTNGLHITAGGASFPELL